jgi:putative membrane protein
MKNFFKILLTALAVMVLASFLPGIEIEDNYLTAVVVAIVISLLNMFIRPLLIFLTLPATIVTFGLFLLVINAVIVLFAGKLVDGFTVSGFWTALIFSLLLSLFRSYLFSFFEDEKENH